MKIARSRPRMRIQRTSKYWSLHTHSRYSVNDAMAEVKDIVTRAVELNQPAVALTDHGNMAGSIQLYQECMKVGIKPFPGTEMYFVPDLEQYKLDYKNKHKKAERFHFGMVAYDYTGYQNLVAFNTLAHRNHFHKPTLDFSMLAQMAEDGRTEGLAITTGCFFGYAVQSLIHRGEDALRQYLATLETWFPRSVYVEIQNHRIDHDGTEWSDDSVADAMAGVAQTMGLPVVITQDSHYVRPDDRGDHEALKRLVAFGPDPDDAVFPGDGFHMADEAWIRDHHSGPRLTAGLEGLGDLLDRHRLSIPVLDSYSYSVPEVVKDPQQVMQSRVTEALEAKFWPQPIPRAYKNKYGEEIEVIQDSGMAGYMMLVAQVTDWLKENHVIYQTRGSAAGSLVCWMLGISNVDPIKWDLRFERFLSRDRTKPPDVDLDIAHDRREELMAWLNTRFTAHQIGTWGEYSLEDDEDEEDDSKGSLRVKYFSNVNKNKEDDEKINSWTEVPQEDRDMLERLSARKLLKGMGTNAAGVVITSTPEEFHKLVPLAYMTRAGGKSGLVSQYSKDDIESLGLVKLDVLGSKTLTVMQKCMDNLSLHIDELENIEYKDAPTFQLIRSGYTHGVFQLEGKTTMRGCKDLGPTTIKDVIAAMALFRTGVMQGGGTKAYIARKHKRQAVPQRHELIEKITKPTYGVFLYQEQVIDMLRGLGMNPDDLTAFLKAVKASNKEVAKAKVIMEEYKAWITEKCIEIGMSDEDRAFLDAAIAGFSEYSFNRAHSTVYGITAYRCAYLAARHPLEFHAALLAVSATGEKKKHERYMATTRRRGVKILKPDLNVSGASFTVDRAREAVRRGLVSVDGVGERTATVLAELAPYSSVADLVERTPARPVSGGKNFDGTLDSLEGVLGKLRDAGLLDAL